MERKKGTGHWIYSGYQWIKSIDAEDKKGQMFIHKTMDVTPFHYFSVIKMNSTYLELCNRPYQFYGLISFIFIGVISIPLLFLPSFVLIDIIIDTVFKGNYFDISSVIFVMLGFSILNFVIYKTGITLLKQKELKSYYYLPIRLNRKNKKVYVYQDTGEVKILDWEKLFVYVAPVDWLYGIRKYELRGAIIGQNDKVEYSFSFGGPSVEPSSVELCVSYWEFLKQYMQKGPEKFYIDKDCLNTNSEWKLSYCNDIDQKLESYGTSKSRIIDNYKFPASELIWGLPIWYPWLWVRRYLIKHQAKIPLWNKEINEECKIEQDDPFIVDASINEYFEIKPFLGQIVVKRKYRDRK